MQVGASAEGSVSTGSGRLLFVGSTSFVGPGALMFGGTARDGAARGRGAGRREGADGTVVRPRGRRVGWAGLGPRGLKRCCSAELTIFLGVVFPSTGEADARRGWSAVKLTRSYLLALTNTRRCLLTSSLAVINTIEFCGLRSSSFDQQQHKGVLYKQ